MERKVGGVGMLVLLVVVAIVLFLTAKAWQSMAPTVPELTNPGAILETEVREEAGATSDGRLPRLGEMKRNTDQHAQEVERMMEETNQ